MKFKKTYQSGFTLIEIVIAITILSVMLGIGYSSMSGISRSKVLLDDERDLRFLADSVLGRLSRELQLAAAGMPLMPARDQLQQPNTLRASLRGEAGTLGDSVADSISFVALEGGQYIPDGQAHSGLVQLTYRLVPDPEAGSSTDTYILLREETPYVRPFEKAYERSMIFPAARNVLGLRLRYLDGDTNEWVAEWGNEQRQFNLPQEIEFTVSVRSPRGRIKEFSTAVPLRTTE